MDNQNQSQPSVPPTNPKVEIDHDKLWSIVAYFLFLIPMLVVKNRSSFLNYHINQGINFLLVNLIISFGFGLLPWWMGFFIMIRWIWNLAVITLLVIGIKNVLEKKMEPLPVIGKLFTFLK